MKTKLLFSIFFFLGMVNSYGQLPNFTLKVDVTNETCLGNGMLTISASNTDSGATLTYQTYKLPNTNSVISASNPVSGLTSGDYRVVVTQTKDGESNSQQQDVKIENKVIVLTYSLTSTTNGCSNTGSITVNVLTGKAVQYEIIKGPKIVPPQTSNVFENLTAGQYRISVQDDCGDTAVNDYTLILGTSNLNISPGASPALAASCNDRDFINTVTPSSGTQIPYPLTVKYTVHPPGNPDYVINQTISTGPVDILELKQNLPVFPNKIYTYDILITDPCGKKFTLNGNGVSAFIDIKIIDATAGCDNKFMQVTVSNLVPPFTVNFDSSPSGFDPKNYNQTHPTFSQSAINYGAPNKSVPFGKYTITVTDKCGITATLFHEIKYEPLNVNKVGFNAGCGANYGTIQISLPENRKITKVVIASAPSTYSGVTDVSSDIGVTGVFMKQDLPLGLYDLTVTDECGMTYNIDDLEVPAFVKQGLIPDSLPNCTFGSGSISLQSGNGDLVSIKITQAPSNFVKKTPVDVTDNLHQGILYMSDLPEGDYQFEGVDSCGFTLTLDSKVIGYDRTDSGFVISRNCGAFDLALTENSNGTLNASYWLQKLNPNTNVWEHPFTGNDYPEGTVPSSSNSYNLTNNQTAYNLTAMGNFRVLKVFQSYANAATPNTYKDCIETLGTFEYIDQVKIIGVYSLDCGGGAGASSVVVDVQGVPPFTYKITEKDGDTSFVIDNGNKNVFNNLPLGTYNFQVGDSCSGLKNGKYTVGNIPKLVEAYQPTDMLICNDGSVQNDVFDLTQKSSEILKNQDSNVFKVTYHKSSADAENSTNPIPNPSFFVNEINPQSIYARVVRTDLDLCHSTTSFQLFVGKTPQLKPMADMTLCEGESKVISTEPGYDLYQWSTTETTQSITVSSGGVYSVTVKNSYNNLTCEASKSIKVVTSGIAKIDQVEINDWNDTTNSISVKVSGSGLYEYSLDNESFQNENLFTDLLPGKYTVYVRDKNGCGTVPQEVGILSYPKYFTPNGDGYNDKWQIKYSTLEPELKVYIFDRYGKLITGIDAFNSGWDGTLDGQPLPSTDYWFTAERADGKVYKGHFSLKR